MNFFGISEIGGVQLIILFFVPGFISMKVYDLLVPTGRRDFSRSFLEAVSYGCINFAIWFWLIALINRESFYTEYQWLYLVLWFLVLFISPIVWPVVLKNLLFADWLRKKIVHPVPKAWDDLFGRKEPLWILVHLKNGHLIGGLYAENSFASSFPNPQDLYLEEIWKVDANGRFIEKIERTRGLLIKDEEIEYLEFFRMHGRKEDD